MWPILKKFLKIAFIPAIVIIILVNVFIPKDDNKDVNSKITKAVLSGNNRIAKDEYEKLLGQDFFNIEYHRGYISSHLSQPEYIGKHRVRNDNIVIDKYLKYSLSNDKRTRDVGFYGLGYFYAYKDESERSLENYKKVEQKAMPFLNNSIGRAYLDLGQYELAKPYFYREIEINGYLEGAYINLAEALYSTKEYEKLDQLANSPNVKQYLPSYIMRFVEIRSFKIFDYLKSIISFSHLNIYGFIGAALILLCWFLYLKNIDIFEPEPLKYTITTLIMGMLFSTLTIPLYDIADFLFGFRLNGNFINDLFYCIFCIGIIEECIKIIPVIIILKYTKAINESTDYIIYGSISALGFAFMENLLYFHDGGLINITSRALSSVIMHMALTSIVMYGIFYSKYKTKEKLLYYLGLSFGGAILIHGIYDIFLVSKGFISHLSIISFIVLMYCIVSYSKALNCALNYSEFMVKVSHKLNDQTEKLCYYLSAVTLLQYIFIAYRFGVENANWNLLWTLFSSYYLICLIIVFMGNMNVQKFKWIPIIEGHKLSVKNIKH